jgi:hypothetical protein
MGGAGSKRLLGGLAVETASMSDSSTE